MSIIKYINGIPAFSTKKEAITWGKQNLNISGYHIHAYNKNNIYMAGGSHEALIIALNNNHLQSKRDTPIIKETPLANEKWKIGDVLY